MVLRTSAVAVCCSCASCSSRRSRATSVSWPEADELLWRTAFGAFALRLRALGGLLLALERRRIAHPRLRTTPILTDYIRDWRPAKWGPGAGLHGSNSKPLMSALGQKQTFGSNRLMSALRPKADIRTNDQDVCFVPKADSCAAAKNT